MDEKALGQAFSRLTYRANYRDHLINVKMDTSKVTRPFLTVEPENNAKLLETRGGEVSRWQGDLILGQILHDLLHPLNVLGELGIICLISLLDLFCFPVKTPFHHSLI